MNRQHTKLFTSFPKLNLIRKNYSDICYLAGYIANCKSSDIAILEMPDLTKLSDNPNITFTSVEQRIVGHFTNCPNEILIIDEVNKKLGPDKPNNFEDTAPLIIIPIQDADNNILGVICISFDLQKKWSDRQLDALKALANQTVSLITLISENESSNDTFVDNTNITIGHQTEIDGTVSWKLNTVTGCLDTNDLFYKILGHTPNSLQLNTLKEWINLIYFIDRDHINNTFQNWSTGELLEKEVECRMLHKSGDILFLNVKINNTRADLNGRLYEIEGEIQEITTQKTVWEQIELINPKQTSVIQAGYKWMAITEIDGTLNYVNNILTLALGYSPEELIGTSLFDFIHEPDREMVKSHFSKFLNNKPFVSKPFRILDNKGNYKWIEVILVNLQEDPMINGIVVNARDITEWITKNKKIKSSEEKHRLLFNTSPYPKYILALDSYQIMDVNEAMISFYGYSREEFMKMTALDLRPKKEIKKLLKGINEFQLQSKTLNSGIYIHRKKNGELVKMDIVGQHITLNEKKCILVTCNDVTDREQYLLQLKRSERKLKKATAIAKLGYWKLQTNSLSCSEEVYNIFGQNIESTSFDLDTFFDAVHPKDKHLFIDTHNNKITNKRNFDLVFRILLKDNLTKWIHLTGQLIIDDEGSPKLYEGTIQDITAQRKEEHKQRLLESVVTNTKEAVMVTEAVPTDVLGLRILYVNDAFCSMTGYSSEEILHKTPSILQGPKSDKYELARLRDAMDRWEPCDITTINYRKNGEEFWVNLSLNPIADESGEYTHWISIARDVTGAKYEEIQKNLLIDIGVLFGHEKELKPCLINVLDYLTSIAEYSLGEIWLLNSENTHLKLVADYNNNIDHPGLNRNRQEKLFSSGEGIVGSTWEKQSIQVWNKNNKTDIQVLDYPEFDKLEKLIGIPLIHNEQCIGVLIIGIKNANKSIIFQKGLFSELAKHLAAEIKRKLIEIELDHIINCAPDIICKSSADGYFKKINKSASSLLGYSEDELLSKKFIEFVHPEDQKITLNLYSKLFQGNSYQHFENRFITKQGRTVWLSWSAKSIEEEGAVYAVAKDITENKELKNLLNEVTDLTLTGGWELNFKNSQIYWSDMTKKIHEVEPNYKPTIESTLSFYKDGEAREIILAVIENAIQKREPWDLEIPIVTAKGQDRWVRMIGKPEFIKNQCIRIFGSFQDINDLKTSQFRMEKTNREKNNILESIGDAFISVDHNWTVNYCNAKANEVLNIDKKNILGHNLWSALKNQFSPQAFIKYLKPIKKGETIYFQDYFTFIDKWLDISIYPTENTLSLYIRDITEKKLNQVAVEKQNERLREIAWTQSHVVRAPLARMLGLIDLIKEEELCEREKNDLLEHIYSSATELDSIIKNIVHKSQLVIEIDKSNMIDKGHRSRR